MSNLHILPTVMVTAVVTTYQETLRHPLTVNGGLPLRAVFVVERCLQSKQTNNPRYMTWPDSIYRSLLANIQRLDTVCLDLNLRSYSSDVTHLSPTAWATILAGCPTSLSSRSDVPAGTSSSASSEMTALRTQS